MDFDLVILGGLVIDGTGGRRYHAQIGLQDDRIAAISRWEPLQGRATLDATGLAVAPGFIDLHSHADWVLPLREHSRILAPLVLQGITTVVCGNCGFSPAPASDGAAPLLDDISEPLREEPFPYRWRTFAEFLAAMEQDGLLLNAGFLVGHSTLRTLVMQDRTDPPNEAELEALASLTREALRAGALGLSVGLAYSPGVFAANGELLAMLRGVAEEDALWTAHGRAYTWVSPFYRPGLGAPHNQRSVRELLELARTAGARLQLSHLIFVGRRTWGTHKGVLREIEQAAEGGLDVAFDAFPYTMGNSTIKAPFPGWFLDGFAEKIQDRGALQRLKREISLLQPALGFDYRDIRLLWGAAPELSPLEGLDFETIARRLGQPNFEAYIHVARSSQGRARILLGTFSGDGEHEEALRAVLKSPFCAFATDTIVTGRGKHNPASFGTYPRLLGRYCRDLELFPLEEAVRRMTSLPAERIGLNYLGRIAEGWPADLVLFEPETIADQTAPERANAPPRGIRAVLIGGQIVARDGALVPGPRLGRVLKR